MKPSVETIHLHSFEDPMSYVGQHIYSKEWGHYVIKSYSRERFFCLGVDDESIMNISLCDEFLSSFSFLGHIDGGYSAQIKVMKRIYNDGYCKGWNSVAPSSLPPSGVDTEFDKWLNSNIDLLDSHDMTKLLPF